jgi:hypothetical protein
MPIRPAVFCAWGDFYEGSRSDVTRRGGVGWRRMQQIPSTPADSVDEEQQVLLLIR